MRTLTKTPVEIKTMARMEEILSYVITHIDEDLDIDLIAEKFEYNPRYFARIFRDYFEIPFHKYVVMLRLRQAAQIILWKRTIKGHWNEFGYMNKSSFSKAFRQEFGQSPEHFLKTETAVPQMPVRESLFGRPVSMRTEEQDAFEIDGIILPQVHTKDFRIQEQLGYWLKQKAEPGTARKVPETACWYCVTEDRHTSLQYICGTKTAAVHPNSELSSGRIMIHKGTYAVFTMPMTGSDEDKLLSVQILSRYIFNDWRICNHIQINDKGVIFETYENDAISIHVPMIDQDTSSHTGSETGTGAWASYIDNHIRDNISIEKLADWAGYSERSFSQVFRLYYGLSPEDYILKKRLYLSAKGLKRTTNLDVIARRYHFDSLEHFRNVFHDEFGVYPEDAGSLSFQSVNLESFYNKNKKNIHLSFRNEKQIHFIAVPISRQKTTQNEEDIPALAAEYFSRDADAFAGTIYEQAAEKIAIWDEIPNLETGEMMYEYVLGPATEFRPDISALPREIRNYELKGGWYAVFETENASDAENLEEQYRFLTRCAFFGWLHENLYRYDGSRLTFVRYKNGKLYFYVPVNC